ncbi:MAG: hypothetical protein LBL38_01475 [Lactobacillales bacterium]|nr:hypothetical protein [Lactobacillales bacterium]
MAEKDDKRAEALNEAEVGDAAGGNVVFNPKAKLLKWDVKNSHNVTKQSFRNQADATAYNDKHNYGKQTDVSGLFETPEGHTVVLSDGRKV